MTSVVNSDSTNRMLNQYRMQINVLTNQLDQYKQAIEFLIEDNKKRKSREEEAIEEKEKIINQFRCVVCFSKQKTIVFEPCLHFSTCRSCSDKVSHCPICRCEFESRLPVFGE